MRLAKIYAGIASLIVGLGIALLYGLWPPGPDKFTQEDIMLNDEVIGYIVENYTHKEKGVRNLKRSLEIIYTKLNLYRLMKPDSKLFEQEMTLKVEFPYTVTSDIVKKLIKMDETKSNTIYGLYV